MIDCTCVRPRSHRRVRKDSLDFGSKEKPVGVRQIEKRLFPHAITCQKKRLTTRVPDRKCKHAAKAIETLTSVLLVRVHDHLCIAMGPKDMAARLKVSTQVLKIV